MKRIAYTLKDILATVGTAVILVITLLMACNASAQEEDIYEIEQTIDQSFNQIYISSGWDARLIQAPKGSPTRVVLVTPYAEFFEEGSEPNIVEVKRLSNKNSWLHLKPNQSMPHSTMVEIHTAQPIDVIHLYRDAHLTIGHFDFDSIDLDIDVDTSATLVVDTMYNRWSTSFSIYDGALDIRHFYGKYLHMWAYGHSSVTCGEIRATRFWQRQSTYASLKIDNIDSVRHHHVYQNKSLNHANGWFRVLNLNFGFNVSVPIVGTDGARHGSPYNTYFDLGYIFLFGFNTMSLNSKWSLDLNLQVSTHSMLLDNVVKVDGDRLLLDDSYGAIAPRQNLEYWTIGIPVRMRYTLGSSFRPYFRYCYFSLMPMVNFKQTLITQTLNENNRWNRNKVENLNLLNRFNLRASFGINTSIMGLNNIEFFIDLLPTYKPSSGAPQTRMMGLVYHF